VQVTAHHHRGRLAITGRSRRKIQEPDEELPPTTDFEEIVGRLRAAPIEKRWAWQIWEVTTEDTIFKVVEALEAGKAGGLSDGSYIDERGNY